MGTAAASVFVRRRIAVGIVALLAVLALVWAATQFGWPAAASGVSPSSAGGSSTGPATDATSTDPEGAPGKPAEPAVVPPPASVTCDAGQMTIAIAGSNRVKVGVPADLTVSIANTGEAACVQTVQPTAFALTITSGSDEIWSSRDCATYGPSGEVTIQPGTPYLWSTTWNRHRSNKCKIVADDLGAGTYVAVATLGRLSSAKHVMILHW